jgi:hypothetical protein
VVAGQDSLPDLTLHGSGLDAPLALRVNEPTAETLAIGLVERALVRVTVGEDGSQLYRASLLLRRRPRSTSLSLDLPALASIIHLETSLVFNRENGAASPQGIDWQSVDDRGQVVSVSRTVRLDIDGSLLAHRPAVLEVQYQLSPDLTRSGSGILQSTLLPPLVRNDAGRFPVYWQIWLPAHWLPVSQRGGLTAEQHWGWRGWLLGPQSALSAAEMERWFYPEGMPLKNEGATPALGISAFSLEPLRISHAPRQAWLALCSGVLVVLGLGLYVVPWPRIVLWSAAVLLAVVVMGVSLFSTAFFMDLLYGCEPGALALLLVFGVQWVLHQRYRRQVVFMPAFQRRKSGSSLVRTGSSNRPRGEPSTVDALPPGEADPWAASAPRAEGSSKK